MSDHDLDDLNFIDPDELRATSANTGKPWLDDAGEDDNDDVPFDVF